MYIPYINSFIVEIPKCASTSLRSAVSSFLFTHTVASHATLQQHISAFPGEKTSYAVVRDPIERLKSAVQYSMRQHPDKISVKEIKKKFLASLSKNKLKRPLPENIPFYPQYSFIISYASINLYTIENINILLSDIGIKSSAPLKNSSQFRICTDELFDGFGEDFINDFYSIDFSLYNDVKCAGAGALRVDSAADYIFSLR